MRTFFRRYGMSGPPELAADVTAAASLAALRAAEAASTSTAAPTFLGGVMGGRGARAAAAEGASVEGSAAPMRAMASPTWRGGWGEGERR